MPTRFRPVAAMLAALFALSANGGPLALHDCPQHRSHAAAPAGATGAGHRAGPASDHAGAHAAEPAADPGPAGSAAASSSRSDAPGAHGVAGAPRHHDPGERGACRCIGDCQGGASAPLTVVSATVAILEVIAAAPQPAAPARAALPTASPYFLPFANAPPASLRS